MPPRPALARAIRGAVLGAALLSTVAAPALEAQEARFRWDRLCQIRQEKFDLILPEAMRENEIQMWITVQKEGELRPPL